MFRLSFEFFPPNSPSSLQNIISVAEALAHYNPEYYSMTCGALGAVKTKTEDAVAALMKANFTVAPHVTCIGETSGQLLKQLHRYRELGIKQIVALRGDLATETLSASPSELSHASDLVTLIQKEFGDQFEVEVAAYPEKHPEATNLESDIRYLKQKVQAGASCIITQYFYNIDAFLHFRELCQQQGITAPIIPGIMPITNSKDVFRFSRLCGAEVPHWIELQLSNKNDADCWEFGIEVVEQLCQQLLAEGVPGLHFYTLNQLEPTKTILDKLGLVSG